MSLSNDATYPFATILLPWSWVICSPISTSLDSDNPIPERDENAFSVKVTPAPENVSGFFIIPTWANFVSIGKSLVESSNLAYNNTLSAPNSL